MLTKLFAISLVFPHLALATELGENLGTLSGRVSMEPKARMPGKVDTNRYTEGRGEGTEGRDGKVHHFLSDYTEAVSG